MIDETWIGAMIAAYLLGNISPSIILGRLAGVDIKKEGSGNAGTTNTLRVLGKKAAVLTLLVDIGKGVAAVCLGRAVGGEALAALCGFLAFAGHIWPALFRFKGGKGVATAFGVAVALDPRLGFLGLGIVVLAVLAARRVSVGSVAVAVLMPPAAYFIDPSSIRWTLVMGAIILYTHRGNIARLIRGEEPPLRFGKSKNASEDRT